MTVQQSKSPAVPQTPAPAKDFTKRWNVPKELAAQGVTSFFCAVMSWQICEGELHFRVLLSSCKAKNRYQVKVPGGEDAQDGETVYEAARREWFEEAMRPNSSVELDADHLLLVHELDCPDDKIPGGKHRKMFFVFPEKSLINHRGDMHFRMTPKKDGEDILSGTWLASVDALASKGGGSICFSHLKPLAWAILSMAKDRFFFPYLSTDLIDWAEVAVKMDRATHYIPRRVNGN